MDWRRMSRTAQWQVNVYYIQQQGHGNPRRADGCAIQPSPGRAGVQVPYPQHPSTARDAAAPKTVKSVKRAWTCERL